MSEQQTEQRAAHWRAAGHAWGARATDWAYLMEPYARTVNTTVFEHLGIGEGSRLLDVACGSGYAAMLAAELGTVVSGIDASEELVAIARSRTPSGDFRVGDMFDLPFGAATFDAAVSFNGIWAGCESALGEVRRVVRPGGKVALTFWGAAERIGLLPYFFALGELSPLDHTTAMLSQADTGRTGVAEQMLAAAGLVFETRGSAEVVNEWPDLDTAVRALAAAGPSWPAIQTHGERRFGEVVADALAPLVIEGIGLRIVSEFGWVSAMVPT
ncbi:MAG: class I SAM-dependent methyltransferase [Acidimicrobiales bacterium]